MQNQNLKPKNIFTTEKKTHIWEQCSTLVIKKMQIIPRDSTSHPLTRKEAWQPKCWWGCGITRLPYAAWRRIKCTTTLEIGLAVSLKTYVPRGPVLLTKTLIHKIWRRMLRTVLFIIAKIWAQPNIPEQENGWTKWATIIQMDRVTKSN